MPQDIEKLSQPQQERLFYIEFRLYFLGSVNRNDLVIRFGLKNAAASRDFALYRQLAPYNIEYDTSIKAYIPRESFRPLYTFTGNQVFAALEYGFGDDYVGTQEPAICTEAPSQLNLPDINTLAAITRAIYTEKVLELIYYSLTSGKTTRQFVPYALVDTGFRWHVRGYDRMRERFADFVINRIEAAAIINSEIPETETKQADKQWHTMLHLDIAVHPNIHYPEVILREYAMVNGLLTINCRAATAGYLLRRWNVDCSIGHNLQGAEYQLCLKNIQALADIPNLYIAPGYSIGS